MSKSTRRVSHNTCLLDYITRCLFITEIRIIRFKLTDSSHAAKAVFAKAVPTVRPRGRRWPQEEGVGCTDRETNICMCCSHSPVGIYKRRICCENRLQTNVRTAANRWPRVKSPGSRREHGCLPESPVVLLCCSLHGVSVKCYPEAPL